MTEFIVVLVTVGSAEEGERIADALVEERLAACVNRLGPVRSTYRWQGKIERGGEDLLVIKSRRDLFERLQQRVRELHSYSTPEIVALPILAASESYLRWLEDELPHS
ncbi:MAG TPA: divalent-cation tolerance protein CutA [Candidatus Binatia bacterium]